MIQMIKKIQKRQNKKIYNKNRLNKFNRIRVKRSRMIKQNKIEIKINK